MTLETIERASLRTLQDLRAAGRSNGWRSTNWRYIADRLARESGKPVIAWRCDDTLVTFTPTDDGRVSRKSRKPNTWRIAW